MDKLSWLLGEWITDSGVGKFPTIKQFSYCEELTFSTAGQPIFLYSTKSWNPETLRPMHMESGFLRKFPGSETVSLMSSHNFGLTTLEEGNFNESEKFLTLDSKNISRMTGAKDPAVTALRRKISLQDNGSLEIVTFMATTKTPELTEHLRAVYKRK